MEVRDRLAAAVHLVDEVLLYGPGEPRGSPHVVEVHEGRDDELVWLLGGLHPGPHQILGHVRDDFVELEAGGLLLVVIRLYPVPVNARVGRVLRL